MPDSHTHDVLTVATGAALAAPVVLLAGRAGLAGGEVLTVGIAFFTAHCLSGMLFSPDLDMDRSDLWGRSRGRKWSNRVLKRWGPLAFLWYPYARILPHRSPISHSYILGALIRLIYFAFISICLIAMIGSMLELSGARILGALGGIIYGIAINHPGALLGSLIGFVTGADTHVWADRHITSSRIKGI